jgi:hypothetical protein
MIPSIYPASLGGVPHNKFGAGLIQADGVGHSGRSGPSHRRAMRLREVRLFIPLHSIMINLILG